MSKSRKNRTEAGISGMTPETAIPSKFAPLFSSKSDEWTTPQQLFDRLDRLYDFELDPCCTDENAKCGWHFVQKDDGLSKDWEAARVWMNPPYGDIAAWMRKAYEESKKGAMVVCLVPSRTDTVWWHEYAERGQYCFIRGRVKFGALKTGAPFPSALVCFGCEPPMTFKAAA